MPQTLSSLVVDLKLENAQLKKGIDDANKKLSGFEGQLAKMGDRLKGIGQAMNLQVLVSAVQKLGQFVLAGAEAADKMGKLSQSTGVAVDKLSALDYAAGMSGLTTDEFAGALGKLGNNLADAAAGVKNQTALFGAMGIAVRDAGGHIRATDDVLLELADKFSKMEDTAAKGKLAVEFFGKSGRDLVPFLNEGKDGIAALTAEAEKLGVVMSDRTTKDAERFNDTLDKFHRIVQGVAVQVAAKLAPAFTKLLDRLLESKDGMNAVKGAVVVLVNFFKVLASGAMVVAAAFQIVGTFIGGIVAEIVAVAEGDFGRVAEIDKDVVKEIGKHWDDLKGNLDAIWSDTPMEDALDRTGKKSKKTADDVLAEAERMKKGLDEARAKMDQELALKSEEMSQGADSRRQKYEDSGPKGGVFGQFTESPDLKRAKKSLHDFDNALDTLTQAQIGYEREIAEAQQLEKEGKLEEAAFAREAAGAQKGVAKAAEEAVTAFEDAAKRQAAAVDGLIDHFAAKMGKTGDVLQSAGQGFQAGGWWGAIIAAILELVSGSQQFADIIKVLDGFLDGLGDAFGDALISVQQVLSALQPLLNGIGPLIKAIIGLVNQTHDVDHVFAMLRPLINVIMNVINAIMPLIDLFSSLGGVLDIFGFVITIVTVILNIVSLTILGTVRGLQEIWGGILSVVHDIMKALGQNTRDIDNMIAQNEANKRSTEAKMSRIVNDIAGTDSAGAPPAIDTVDDFKVNVDGASDSLKKLGDTADEVTDQLTNVPTGYKVATQRFLSTVADTLSATFSIEKIAIGVDQYYRRQSFTGSGSPFGSK